jgi:glucuronate isomerase
VTQQKFHRFTIACTKKINVQTFITENFLLETDKARELYFDYVQNLPIVDYHNHLPPNEIAANKKFENLTQIWLKGDHYKWRAMRANGTAEELITGDADDKLKFKTWAPLFRILCEIRYITGRIWN